MYQRPAVTREEIIRSTLMNGGSVSQALGYLIDSRAIVKIGELKSKAGRRRDVVKLNPEAGYFIAVDLETARIRYALPAWWVTYISAGSRNWIADKDLTFQTSSSALKWFAATWSHGSNPASWR